MIVGRGADSEGGPEDCDCDFWLLGGDGGDGDGGLPAGGKLERGGGSPPGDGRLGMGRLDGEPLELGICAAQPQSSRAIVRRLAGTAALLTALARFGRDM